MSDEVTMSYDWRHILNQICGSNAWEIVKKPGEFWMTLNLGSRVNMKKEIDIEVSSFGISLGLPEVDEKIEIPIDHEIDIDTVSSTFKNGILDIHGEFVEIGEDEE